MINLAGIIKMFNFKGKAQRDSDAIQLQAQTYKQLTISDLSNDPDGYTGARFWVVVDHQITEVYSALYTGQMLPNGVAQWAVYQNLNGVPCHAGYVWDDDVVYITYNEYKPIKGAWEICMEMKANG